MTTLSPSWLWTEPWVTPCSRRSPACSGSATQEARVCNWPTGTRAFRLTQGPPLPPPSDDCHQPLVWAAKVEQRLERFFSFFSFWWGDWRWSKAVMSTRFPLPHIYGIKWTAKKKTKFDAYTTLVPGFFWGTTETHSQFCDLRLSAFPSRYMRRKLCRPKCQAQRSAKPQDSSISSHFHS